MDDGRWINRPAPGRRIRHLRGAQHEQGAAAYAIKQLIDSQSELYYRIRFKILSQNTAVNVLKLRTDDNRAILGIYISNVGKLGYRNEVTGMSTSSSADVSRAAWHELQIHVRIAEAAGQIEVWLDNARIDVFSKTGAFGDDAIGKIQLGENATGRTYDIAFDDIAVAAHFINR